MKKYIPAFLMWIIKFTLIKHQYKIEKIIEIENKTFIQYFTIGTRNVWLNHVDDVIRNRQILSKFSHTDACLIGYLSTRQKNL